MWILANIHGTAKYNTIIQYRYINNGYLDTKQNIDIFADSNVVTVTVRDSRHVNKYLHKYCIGRYHRLIEQYSDVVVGQFYGHQNTDTFRLFYNNKSKIGILNNSLSP